MGAQVKKHGYSCKLVRVVDGDTADAMIDLGFNVWVKRRIRFYGVDTWESRTRDLEEKKLGLAAKAYVKSQLNYPDTASFHNMSTRVTSTHVHLKVTAKNAFGVPSTREFSVPR